MTRVKEAALAVTALAGSAVASALGGWDAALQTLVVCMAGPVDKVPQNSRPMV